MSGRISPSVCRVYWGSHGCALERNHDGPHLCSCAIEDEGKFDPKTQEYYDDPNIRNVGAPPYYGLDTHFFGEDAEDGAVGRELVPPAPPQPTGIKRLWLRWKWRGQWPDKSPAPPKPEPPTREERLIRMRIEAEEAWEREAIAADELRDKLVAAEAREQRALDSRDTAIRQLDDARRQRDSERRRGNYWKKKAQACGQPRFASTGKESE